MFSGKIIYIDLAEQHLCCVYAGCTQVDVISATELTYGHKSSILRNLQEEERTHAMTGREGNFEFRIATFTTKYIYGSLAG